MIYLASLTMLYPKKMTYIHISGYLFTPLDDLANLQMNIKTICLSLSLKGTILLSTEGINIFVCGAPSDIKQFSSQLSSLGFPPITFKESKSDNIPFKYMRVKIKTEIITFGIPTKPSTHPAPSLPPETFNHWLSQEKEMLVLDTRNDYEVRLGKFKNAVDLNISHFRQFPAASQQILATNKDIPIITYCTGGIRCEKAALYLMSLGFKEVYQLEGGILNYFEKCAGVYFEGECFVFDKRMALNSQLEETSRSLSTQNTRAC